MRYPLEPLDCDGNRISTGDDVVFVHASANLLRGLPVEDQAVIVAHVGEIVNIAGVDESGFVELEFEERDEEGGGVGFRTIWVEPRHLKKT